MVAAGHFREDLYYRLKGFLVRTPSLAERQEDILLLATGFLRSAAPAARFGADVPPYLVGRSWPGNVRELRALVEGAAALAPQSASDIDAAQLRFAAGESFTDPALAVLPSTGSLNDAIAALETHMISETMAACNGNQSEAARKLGISRLGLIKKLARLGLRTP